MQEKYGSPARLARTVDTQATEWARNLGRLVPLWPYEISDRSLAGRQRLLAALRKALRSERQRGLSGHWTYDLARHRSLLEAYRAEASAAMPPGQAAAAQQ
ncbi:MAG: hypothetical protein Q7T86_11365 [Hyphomicrobiaceae bacterium]|nr:hypothetical protein [Hyphomicrobiaceae bacterium]